VAIGELGRQSDTQDLQGEIIATQPFDHVTLPNLKQCMNQFLGTIIQTPPVYVPCCPSCYHLTSIRYSALKLNGKPLYELARKGIPVDVSQKARPVTIHSIELLKFEPPYFQLGTPSCVLGPSWASR
jgi:tRNA pseudouridine55 synthase